MVLNNKETATASDSSPSEHGPSHDNKAYALEKLMTSIYTFVETEMGLERRFMDLELARKLRLQHIFFSSHSMFFSQSSILEGPFRTVLEVPRRVHLDELRIDWQN